MFADSLFTDSPPSRILLKAKGTFHVVIAILAWQGKEPELRANCFLYIIASCSHVMLWRHCAHFTHEEPSVTCLVPQSLQCRLFLLQFTCDKLVWPHWGVLEVGEFLYLVTVTSMVSWSGQLGTQPKLSCLFSLSVSNCTHSSPSVAWVGFKSFMGRWWQPEENKSKEDTLLKGLYPFLCGVKDLKATFV